MDIVQITDLHLSKDKGNELYNINTYNSAKTIIEYIAKHKKSIDYLIITGDISEDSTMQSYSHLLDLLKPIKSNIYLMPGNHDSYEQIKLCCSLSTVKSDIFFSNDKWVVFMFNTKKEHSPNGFLKQDEIELFKKLLSDYPNKNFMIFLHHHPVLIGSESMDTMIIENAQLLIDLIKSHNNIKGVSCLKPSGAFYVFPSCKKLLGKKTKLKTDSEFVEKLLEKANVAVVQGSAFGLDGYFRISYATSMEKLKIAMERIKSFCESLS